MKKTISLTVCLIIVCIAVIIFGFIKYDFPKNAATQPGTFFFDNEDRFILVDYDKSSDGSIRVIADKVTGVMYLEYHYNFYTSFCPLYNTDGTLMIYDEG